VALLRLTFLGLELRVQADLLPLVNVEDSLEDPASITRRYRVETGTAPIVVFWQVNLLLLLRDTLPPVFNQLVSFRYLRCILLIGGLFLLIVVVPLGFLDLAGLGIRGGRLGTSKLLLLLSILLLLVFRLFLVQDNLLLHLVQVDQWGGKHVLVHEVEFLALLEGEGYILGLEVGMYDLAYAVHVVQRHQQLLGDLSNDGHGDATVVVAPHQG